MARKKKTEADVEAQTQYAQTVSAARWDTWGTWSGIDGPTRVQLKPGVRYEVVSATDTELVIKHNITGTEITVSRSIMTLE